MNSNYAESDKMSKEAQIHGDSRNIKVHNSLDDFWMEFMQNYERHLWLSVKRPIELYKPESNKFRPKIFQRAVNFSICAQSKAPLKHHGFKDGTLCRFGLHPWEWQFFRAIIFYLSYDGFHTKLSTENTFKALRNPIQS